MLELSPHDCSVLCLLAEYRKWDGRKLRNVVALLQTEEGRKIAKAMRALRRKEEIPDSPQKATALHIIRWAEQNKKLG